MALGPVLTVKPGQRQLGKKEAGRAIELREQWLLLSLAHWFTSELCSHRPAQARVLATSSATAGERGRGTTEETDIKQNSREPFWCRIEGVSLVSGGHGWRPVCVT